MVMGRLYRVARRPVYRRARVPTRRRTKIRKTKTARAMKYVPGAHLLMLKNPTVFPEHLKTSLYMSGRSVITPTALASYQSMAIRANSLYDPDYGGYFDNTQPKYFDALCNAAGPYSYYRVHSCVVEVIATQVNSANQIPINLYVFPATTPYSGAMTATQEQEARNAEYGTGGFLIGGTAVRLVCNEKTKHMVGPWNAFGSTAALYSANPATLWYINIFASGDNTSLTVDHPIVISWRIKWFVTFFNQIEQADN